MPNDKIAASWGRFPRVSQQELPLRWRSDALPSAGGTVLPYGMGRSYGDCCLNDGGAVLLTRGLDRLIEFDPASGILRAESGVTLDEILALVVPKGWFLPVTPCTRFVTLGGAIANDVHGKNHHVDGTLGRHITRLELLRSDGNRLILSPEQDSDWFAATIAGMGLTGLITWAEIQLRRIPGPVICQDVIPFRDLDEFLELSSGVGQTRRYSMAWVDVLARGKALGRGVFICGDHWTESDGPMPALTPPRPHRMPVELPTWVLNRASVWMFNRAYSWVHRHRQTRQAVHYEPFFYPLDAILEWNRIYGRPGFLQYQCVVPVRPDAAAARAILDHVAESGNAFSLAVLKIFGTVSSPGMLSFPRPGLTIALDFPIRDQATFRLCDELDAIVREAGGAVYPAKDARMSAAAFQAYFPRLDEFRPFVDPAFSSSLWRRLAGS
jgi:FAD/FMN-containing dehydrogenase